jgi:hypothetical protein
MFRVFRATTRQTLCVAAPTRRAALASSRRAYSSGIKDRERALEEKAARDHDAKLLADLAKQLKSDKAGAPGGDGKNVVVVGAGLMGSGSVL